MTYTLHLGDCLQYMRGMDAGSVDAVVTDPPYVGLKGGVELNGNGVASRVQVSKSIGDLWGASLDWVSEAWRVCRYGMLVFCTHHFVDTLKQSVQDSDAAIGLIAWHKRNAALPQNNVPHFNCEFIWMFKKAPGLVWKNLSSFYDVPTLPAGCFSSERVTSDGFKAAHPTQKPLELMRQLLLATTSGMTVLDPFAGTGTTGVAALQLGRRFIGCEIDPAYYAIAERRIADAAAQPVLFTLDAPKVEYEQGVML